MIPILGTETLTKGVGFFIPHAVDLLSKRADAPFSPARTARLSAMLKFLSTDPQELSRGEKAEFRRTVSVARDLALLAWRDVRWPRLKLPGNPVRELGMLLSLLDAAGFSSEPPSAKVA